MIFATVGTTHFDDLIRTLDALKEAGSVDADVVCQIGSGKYEPRFCEHFKFQPSIDKWIEDADLVICHGGATVMSLLQRNKRFVAIANTALADDHQSKFLTRLAQAVDFPWGREVDHLAGLIDLAMNNPPPQISMPRLADTLRDAV